MEYKAENNWGEITIEAKEACYDFGVTNIEARNEYIRTAENYITFPTGLKNFINRKYGNIPESKLNEFIKKCCQERGINLLMQNIRNWLSGTSNPQGNETSRDSMFQLCFALNFTVEETEEFFSKVYLNRPYDSRNVRDAVYLFCMSNNLPYEKVEELKNCANDIIKAKKEDGKKKENIITHTIFLNEKISKIKSERDFLSFLEVNSDNFYTESSAGIHVVNRTAMRKYEELLNKAKKMEGVTSNDALLGRIYGIKRTSKDRRNITIKKDSMFLKVVKLNFPDKQSMSNIKNNKATYDVIRKALILLQFYCFFMSIENNTDNDFDDFLWEANDMLYECGYSLLYPRNPYDWIFLHCAACSHDKNCDIDVYQPLDQFRDIISYMLGFGDEEEDF